MLLGKTATPKFGCKGETSSPLTGIARNPWNLAAPTGGSSGGAGSVRIPAAFCGTFGLKPSFGRVPAYPLSPFGTVAHIGPHTLSVRDAALTMNAIKGPDAGARTS